MLRSGLACVLALGSSLAPAAITMEMVTVGDTNNPADPLTGYGSVPYTYQIGKYEVRNSEYAEFLNSVAATDTYGLYNVSMGGRIARAGSSGSYTYSVNSGYENIPVVYVSFYDAVRFVNWLENGQPTGAQGAGTTETGSYTLFTSGSSTTNVSGRTSSGWVIPSENEWYKAAHYQPSTSGGPADSFWLYPTQSDAVPSNDLIDPDPGNNANFYQNNGYTLGGPVYLSEVGAFENSQSYYGTFDQAGNTWEWTEALIGSDRVLRGGDWVVPDLFLQSTYRLGFDPSAENSEFGFRVAIPEPRALMALALAALAAWVWRRRRR